MMLALAGALVGVTAKVLGLDLAAADAHDALEGWYLPC